MKRIAILLSVPLCILFFAGCGSTEPKIKGVKFDYPEEYTLTQVSEDIWKIDVPGGKIELTYGDHWQVMKQEEAIEALEEAKETLSFPQTIVYKGQANPIIVGLFFKTGDNAVEETLTALADAITAK